MLSVGGRRGFGRFIRGGSALGEGHEQHVHIGLAFDAGDLLGKAVLPDIQIIIETGPAEIRRVDGKGEPEAIIRETAEVIAVVAQIAVEVDTGVIAGSLDTLAEGEKLVPYLDMPLQHCNDEILKRMHRRGSNAHIRNVLDHIRKNYPDFTLRTTMMVGFPGETDAQFAELMQFLRDYPFDRVGAFAFSPEEGTAAAELPDQIEDDVKEARLNALMEQQQEISQTCNARWIGRELTMLVEETGMDGTYGRTIREAPDADGTVCIAPSFRHEPGQYLKIRLTQAEPYDMIGESI